MAVLSALLAHRTAFHADALAPLVNAVETDVATLARQVWAAAQMLAFRDCFLVTGVAGFMLAPVALLVSRDRLNFMDRLKGALTLFR